MITRIALSCLLLLAAPAWGAAADIRFLGGDLTGATVELTLPEYRLHALDAPSSRIVATGNVLPYTTIAIPDLTAEGAAGDPRLPAVGTLLGLPAGTRAVVSVIDTDSVSVPAVRIAPLPTLEVPADPLTGAPARTALLESDVYRKNTLFPAQIATIGFSGGLRGQPVAQVLLHPVQTNPVTGELMVHTRIRVQVSFVPVEPATHPAAAAGVRAKASAPAAGRREAAPTPPAFRELMRRSLLNFSAFGD
jgi:hypothetical protein